MPLQRLKKIVLRAAHGKLIFRGQSLLSSPAKCGHNADIVQLSCCMISLVPWACNQG